MQCTPATATDEQSLFLHQELDRSIGLSIRCLDPVVNGFGPARQHFRDEVVSNTLDNVENPVVCLFVQGIGAREDTTPLQQKSRNCNSADGGSTHRIDSNNDALRVVPLLQSMGDTGDGPTGSGTSNEDIDLSGRRMRRRR